MGIAGMFKKKASKQDTKPSNTKLLLQTACAKTMLDVEEAIAQDAVLRGALTETLTLIASAGRPR